MQVDHSNPKSVKFIDNKLIEGNVSVLFWHVIEHLTGRMK